MTHTEYAVRNRLGFIREAPDLETARFIRRSWAGRHDDEAMEIVSREVTDWEPVARPALSTDTVRVGGFVHRLTHRGRTECGLDVWVGTLALPEDERLVTCPACSTPRPLRDDDYTPEAVDRDTEVEDA